MGESTVPSEATSGLLSGRILLLLVLFWVGVGLLAGTTEFLAARGQAGSLAWASAVMGPLLAGVLWIPMTLVISWGSTRYPPVGMSPGFRVHWAAVLGHGMLSVVPTFVLNAAFFTIMQPSLLAAPGEFASLVGVMGLRFLHFNAGAYWIIVAATVAATTWRDRTHGVAHPSGEALAATLTVRSGSSNILVRVSDIRWIEGAGDYVRLHVGLKNHLHSERLKRLELRLDPSRFVRVHRSAIVNVGAVTKLRHLGHGDYEAVMEDGATVRVSRTRRARLSEVLEGMEVPE